MSVCPADIQRLVSKLNKMSLMENKSSITNHQDPEVFIDHEEGEEFPSSPLATDVDQLFVVKTEDTDEWSSGLDHQDPDDDTNDVVEDFQLSGVKEESSEEPGFRKRDKETGLYIKEEEEEGTAGPVATDVQKVFVVKEEVPDEWSFATTYGDSDPFNGVNEEEDHPSNGSSDFDVNYDDWQVETEREPHDNDDVEYNTARKFFCCSICRKQFLYQESFRKHMKGHLEKSCTFQVSEKGFTGKPNLDAEMMDAEKPFGCDVCGKSFHQRSYLYRHRRTHKGVETFSCDICGKTYIDSSTLSKHMSVHSGQKAFGCDVCGKTFFQKSNLYKHKRIHTGEKPFSCDVCGKAFIYKSILNGHMLVHTRERAYGCDVCGKTFTERSGLHKHKRLHAVEQSFICDVCGKSFINKSTLNRHVGIHAIDKPFSCLVCGKTFHQKVVLNRHMGIHTLEKSLECDVCGKMFKQKAHLATHKIIHTGEKPFVCEVCGKAFNRKERLCSHNRIHTGEKPFGCDFCGTMFNDSSTLRKHMRIHTGEKPFGCDVCGKTFRFRSNVKKHMNTHTG